MEKDVQIVVKKFTVASACSAVAQVISEKGPFLLREIRIPEEVARYFMLTDVKVGLNSQFVSAGAVPADFFAGELAGERQAGLCYDIVPRGSRLTLNVTCMGGDVRDFEAVLVGDVVQEEEVKDVVRGRRVFVGLGSTLVRPGQGCVVSVQPQVGMKPTLLVLPSLVAEAFQVTNVRAVGAAAADCSKLKDGVVALDSPVMRIGDWFAVDVENKTDAPRNFQGVVVGELGGER